MSKIDWEAELCFAIGRKGKRIPAERAIEHIAGFLTGNDVSCRDLQIRPTGRACARTGTAASATTISRRWARSWCRAPSCPIT